ERRLRSPSTCARRTGRHAATTRSRRGDDFALGRDRRPLAETLEPVGERGPELDVEPVDRPQDPRNVARIREPVLAAGEVRLRLERVLEPGELAVQHVARLAATDGVVGVAEPVVE